jgi:hippurate hydrolase
VVGEQNVVPLGTTNMAGEDFACYLERIPGCFMRIGVRTPGTESTDVHTPRFVADEAAIAIGARVLAECARQ